MLLISCSLLALCLRIFIERLKSTGMASRIQCPPYLSYLLPLSLIALLWLSLQHYSSPLPWPSITLLFLQFNSPDQQFACSKVAHSMALEKGAGCKSCFMQISMLIGHVRFRGFSGRLIEFSFPACKHLNQLLLKTPTSY